MLLTLADLSNVKVFEDAFKTVLFGLCLLCVDVCVDADVFEELENDCFTAMRLYDETSPTTFLRQSFKTL